MPRLFIANFDFEHRLPRPQTGPRWTLTEAARRLNAGLACAWCAIAGEGDFIRLPAPVEPGFFEYLEACGLPRLRPVFDSTRRAELSEVEDVIPWGWTDDVRRWADRRRLPFSAPPQEAVARANAREFSMELERELGGGLPGAAIIRSFDDLSRALARLRLHPPHRNRWVVKAEFGMSARERMIGMGNAPDRRTADWIRLRLARDGAVYFEPWVERVEEVGIHFTVPLEGPPVFEGVAAILSDEWGRYRGSRIERDPHLEARWSEAIATGARVAGRLSEIGYFGPLGVDACRYRNEDGGISERLIQDINARWTMGALARGFGRLLAPGEFGTWLHSAWPDDEATAPRRAFESLAERLPAGARLVRTSPYVIGDKANPHGSFVVIASTAASRAAVKDLLATGETG